MSANQTPSVPQSGYPICSAITPECAPEGNKCTDNSAYSLIILADSFMPDNQLYCGDNLEVLREFITSESIDLIYLDPPFKSDRDYNLLFKDKSGEKSASQILAFEDTWEWNKEAQKNLISVVERGGKVGEVMSLFRAHLGETDMLAYLAMMAPRPMELHRVLKPTGSLYLHCDSTAAHYLKVLLDAVFSGPNFAGEIVWRRTASHMTTRKWPRLHDTLLHYAKEIKHVFFNPQRMPADPGWVKREYRHEDERGRYMTDNLTGAGTTKGPSGQPWRGIDPAKIGAGRHWRCSPETLDKLDTEGRIYWPIRGKYPKLKQYLHETKGAAVGDVWTDIQVIGRTAAERLGYPTQKPQALLDRIIEASSKSGDLVLDPFCGCGTAIEASCKSRKWIGIDVTYQAMRVIREERFPKLGLELGKDYEMVYRPRDISAAEAFAKEQPFQFQDWIIQILHGELNQQLSGDRGVDGRLYFRETMDGPLRPIIVSVKGGKLKATFVRELAGAVSSEHAPMGILVVIQPHTKQMIRDAANYGFFNCSLGSFPKIQIISVEDILGEVRLDLPPIHRMNWKKRSRRFASQLSLPGIAK
jgi:DNA modification methylase